MEERADYRVPIQVLPGTVEARLVEIFRVAWAEWLRERRRLLIEITPEGAVTLLRAEQAGRICAPSGS